MLYEVSVRLTLYARECVIITEKIFLFIKKIYVSIVFDN